MKLTHEEVIKRVEKLVLAKDMILLREETIKKLGFSFNSEEAQLIVAMTDAFFSEGKFITIKFVSKLFDEMIKENT